MEFLYIVYNFPVEREWGRLLLLHMPRYHILLHSLSLSLAHCLSCCLPAYTLEHKFGKKLNNGEFHVKCTRTQLSTQFPSFSPTTNFFSCAISWSSSIPKEKDIEPEFWTEVWVNSHTQNRILLQSSWDLFQTATNKLSSIDFPFKVFFSTILAQWSIFCRAYNKGCYNISGGCSPSRNKSVEKPFISLSLRLQSLFICNQ